MTDYLNKSKVRNESNTDISMYNCGGFAFRTYSWYVPWEEESELIEEILGMELEKDEAIDYVYNCCMISMCNDFSNISFSFVKPESYDNEKYELIAMRLNIWDVDFSPDIDFHFKVFRDGRWQEKMGSTEIRDCDLNKWDYRDEDDGYCELFFDSRILYILHEVA